MLAPAPVTVSMITGWPSKTRMRSLKIRASVSVGPPGERHDDGDGMRRIGLRLGAADARDCDDNCRDYGNRLHGSPRLFVPLSVLLPTMTRGTRAEKRIMLSHRCEWPRACRNIGGN